MFCFVFCFPLSCMCFTVACGKRRNAEKYAAPRFGWASRAYRVASRRSACTAAEKETRLWKVAAMETCQCHPLTERCDKTTVCLYMYIRTRCFTSKNAKRRGKGKEVMPRFSEEKKQLGPLVIRIRLVEVGEENVNG